MYTRSYFPEEERINVPDNYDGSAFGGEGMDTGLTNVQPSVAEPKVSPRDVPTFAEEAVASEEVHEEKAESAGIFGSLFSKLLFGSILPSGLGNLFKFDKLKIGSEEILLIGIALFLLFSKDGDKECAIMLILLLFVT